MFSPPPGGGETSPPHPEALKRVSITSSPLGCPVVFVVGDRRATEAGELNICRRRDRKKVLLLVKPFFL